jgi:hypothetical protein
MGLCLGLEQGLLMADRTRFVSLGANIVLLGSHLELENNVWNTSCTQIITSLPEFCGSNRAGIMKWNILAIKWETMASVFLLLINHFYGSVKNAFWLKWNHSFTLISPRDVLESWKGRRMSTSDGAQAQWRIDQDWRGGITDQTWNIPVSN